MTKEECKDHQLRCITMTKEEFREEIGDIVEVTVEKSVKVTLIQFGIDTTKPIELQRDFQFLRDWRVGTAAARCKAIMVVMGILIVGVLTAMWIGIKHMVHKP